MAAGKYRERAEIMIWRHGKVLMTVNESPGGTWYGLPGGGIDEGETPVQAAIREALEEVGIKVRDAQDTFELSIKEGVPRAKADNTIMYQPSKTYLIRATYDGTDTSRLGIEGDSTDFKFVSPREFAQVMREHYRKNAGGTGDHALREIMKYY